MVGEIAEERDVMVIGGGPGGYHAAIRVAQLGMTVSLVEQEKLGGMCLNQGCIPSKIFAHAAEQRKSLANMHNYGIQVQEGSVNVSQLQDHSKTTITRLRMGIEKLLEANGVEILEGNAIFTDENRIGIENGHQFNRYEYKHAVIATGVKRVLPEKLTNNSDRVLLAEEGYQLTTLPESIIVYGSDYIAMEVASSFHQLGSHVTIVLDEKEDFPLDDTINKEYKRILKKDRVKVFRGYTFEQIDTTTEEVSLVIEKQGQSETISADYVMASGHYQSSINSLGVTRFGLEIDVDGFVETNHVMRTSISNIFAIGDITTGPKSAMKAIKQGKVAAETIADVKSEVDVTFLPMVARTIPPIASVGLTEEEAKQQGYDIVTSRFAIGGNSYQMLTNDKNGVVHVIMERETELLLGFHMVGTGAIELLSTGIVSLEMVARQEDITFPFYPHPSVNESLMEAIENMTNKAIHIAPN